MGSASGGMRMGALEFLDIITPEEASTLVREMAPVPFFPGLQSSFCCLRHKNVLFILQETNGGVEASEQY